MITTEVTSEQIENWKKIYSENKNNLVVNRISGKELNDYFVEKYHPTKEAPSQFVDTVILNAKENGKQEPIISAYILAGNIYVGIDLNTGFFQVECEDIDKMKIISWILGNVTRIPRHELPQTLDFSDFLPLFT